MPNYEYEGAPWYDYRSNITTVVIENGVTSIGNYAFNFCIGLTSVTNHSTTPQEINANVFESVDLSKATLRIPESAIAVYQAAPVWQDFGTIEGIVVPHYIADYQSYPSTMTYTASVVLDNVELQSDLIEIGAFSGNECRGSALLKDFSQNAHSHLGFLVIHGEGNEAIRLRIYNHATGREYDATNALSFGANAMHGSPAEPYRIVSSTTGINDLQAKAVNVYLESTGGRLQIHRPWDSIDQLEITDLSGRVVLRETGFTAASINVSLLANSVYLLKLTKDNQVYVKKFIKK
jgi:hypothetical protein